MTKLRRTFASELERAAAIQEVLKLHKKRVRQRQIAEQLDLSQPTVHMWIKRYGGPTDAQQRIADKIRAELVCCDIFEQMEALHADVLAQQRLREDPKVFHSICYYGEWAARIALKVTR